MLGARGWRAARLGKSAAYAAAASGRIPTLHLGERRVVVPVPKFLELLGATTNDENAS
ncbi:MAG: hypothetical protein M5U31_04975 [Acidimicrobiia bacterium]|nr:hypothetical protein [Acidimicrobiia bacterium]